MFLGAVMALALNAVPATNIQTQKPEDAADKAQQVTEDQGRRDPMNMKSKNEQEGKVGPAFPADRVLHKDDAHLNQGEPVQRAEDAASPDTRDEQAAKARPEAKPNCAVMATACETKCQDVKAGEELSCKARCKRDELACSTNGKHVHDTTLQPEQAQGRRPTTKKPHKTKKPAPAPTTTTPHTTDVTPDTGLEPAPDATTP